MIECYMIYTDAEAWKNQGFIEMFCRAGERRGLLFSFVSKTSYQRQPLPGLVLNRTRDPQVSRWYEKRHVRVYHDSEIVTVGNDKYKTLQRLEERLPVWDPRMQKLDKGQERNGGTPIWYPQSFPFVAEQAFNLEWMQQKIRNNFGVVDSVVAKTVDGHGGSEVFLLSADPVRDPKTWKRILSRLRGRQLLCQEWIDCASRDLRVYLLWGEIYAAVLRQGKNDFRSNYSVGGSVRAYSLSQEERNQIQPFIQALGGKRLAMAGIDFLVRRDGTLFFNELEEMVGSRMLYQCTDLDIVQDFVDRLVSGRGGATANARAFFRCL